MMAHAACGYERGAWLALPLWTRVQLVLSLYAGWDYATHPRTPFEAVGLPAGLDTGARVGVDCSTLTTSIVMACRPDLPWGHDEYADMQVWDPGRLDSPAEAVQRVGAGVRVAPQGVTRVTGAGVYLFQGWKSLKPLHGHALIGRLWGDGSGVLELIESQPSIGPHRRRSTVVQLAGRYPAALYVARLWDVGER